MSAGAFIISRYAAQYGTGTQIHPIKIQPETQTLSVTIGGTATANLPPAGAVNNPISAIVSGSKRGRGLVPRTISFRFSGTPPAGYRAGSILTLPMLTSALSGAAIGATGTYTPAGTAAAIEVVGISPERVR